MNAYVGFRRAELHLSRPLRTFAHSAWRRIKVYKTPTRTRSETPIYARMVRIETYSPVQRNGVRPAASVIRNHGLVNESVAGTA